MQDHRKLQIWRMACSLAIDVRAAADRFPKRGYAELKQQMISAAESIANTIVEGCGAESNKEFARFLSMSIKSNRELEGELHLAHGYHILTDQRWHELSELTVLIRKKTYTLRKRALESPSDKRRPLGTPNSEPAGAEGRKHPTALEDSEDSEAFTDSKRSKHSKSKHSKPRTPKPKTPKPKNPKTPNPKNPKLQTPNRKPQTG